MGGICPFCPARRIAPSPAGIGETATTDTRQVMVNLFNQVPAIVVGPPVDIAVQTDADELRWVHEPNTPALQLTAITHHDSTISSSSQQESVEDGSNDDVYRPSRRSTIYHKQFTRKEYEEELEMSTFRDELNEDYNVTLGIFYDGQEFSSKIMTMDHQVDPLAEIFKTIQLFDWRNCDQDETELRKRASACDCFLIVINGESLLESAAENFHHFLPNGNSDYRVSPFYGKPASIATDETDVPVIKEMRHFLGTIGAVVMPSILTSLSQLGESKAVSELKLYGIALKLISKASTQI